MLCTRTRGTTKGHDKKNSLTRFYAPSIIIFLWQNPLCALDQQDNATRLPFGFQNSHDYHQAELFRPTLFMLPNKSPKVANFLRLFFFLVGISLVFWQIELNYIIISLNTIFPRPSKVSHYLLSMYRVSHTKAFSGRGGCEVTLHPFFPTPFYIACPQLFANNFLLLIWRLLQFVSYNLFYWLWVFFFEVILN